MSSTAAFGGASAGLVCVNSRDDPLRGPIDYLGSRFQSFGISKLELVSLTFASWNQIVTSLRRLDRLRVAA